MAYRVFIDERALNEINHAIEYYDSERDGLGSEFMVAFSQLVNFLKRFPKFQIRYDLIRCAQVKRFPYLIHYTLDEANEKITIHAVLHTSRDSNIWFVNESM